MSPVQSRPSNSVDLRQSTVAIESNFVSSSSKGTYNSKLVLFTLWLFDNNHREVINNELLPLMIEEDCADEINYRKRMEKFEAAMANQRSKSNRKREPKQPTRTREKLRKLILQRIKQMKPSQHQGGTHQCPFKIEGENAISYEIVRDFMMGKYNTTFVDRSSAEEYLRATSSVENNINAVITDDMVNDDGKVLVQVQQSTAVYEGIRSAITHVFTLCRVPMPEEMRKNLSTLVAGFERSGASETQALGMQINKGKKPMSLEAYELLSKELFQSGKKEDIFAHLFLVLDWCLMKRAENCVHAQIEHIYFLHDSLVFEFAKGKTFQKGEKGRGPWHVYANPMKPWLCPVLALARYLLCYPDVLQGGVPLFEGANQYRRYNTRFLNLLDECKDDLKIFGFDKDDLGSHSCRKGVATMIAAGCTVSPPIVALCIRAGWALGGVKDKYLFRENAGDQYVGRCASCLDQLTKDFAASPPYFDFKVIEKVDDDGKAVISPLEPNDGIKCKYELQSLLKDRLPHFDKISAKTFHVLEMCFASICFHHEYLMETLHVRCPLRSAILFRDIPKSIIEVARIAYPWNKSDDTPQLSGVPPHVLALAEMEGLKQEIARLHNSLITDFKKELDTRGFASTEYNHQNLLSALSMQTDAIVNKLIEKTNLTEKAISDSRRERNDLLHSGFVMTEEDDDNDEDGPYYTPECDGLEQNKGMMTLRHEEQMKSSKKKVQERIFKVGFHHGKLNPLPATYQFPNMTRQQLVTNWLLGDKEMNVPPFWSLNAT